MTRRNETSGEDSCFLLSFYIGANTFFSFRFITMRQTASSLPTNNKNPVEVPSSPLLTTLISHPGKDERSAFPPPETAKAVQPDLISSITLWKGKI